MFHIDSDDLYAAAMLDSEDAPELTEEQFEELADAVRKGSENQGSA